MMAEKGVIEMVFTQFGGNKPIDVKSTTDSETKSSVEIAMLATQIALRPEYTTTQNIFTLNGHPQKTKNEGGSITLAHAMSLISLNTGKVAKNYAASGLIYLDGYVSKVASSSSKCVLADRLGLGIILSKENRENIDTMDLEVKKNLKYQPIFIANVTELISNSDLWSSAD